MSTERADSGRATSGPLGSSHEWNARVRESVRQTERYSHFVAIMKRALPLAAAALLAAVLVYALQPRQEKSRRVAMNFQRLGIVNDDLAMMKPRLTGADDEGDPYTVTAAEAIQDRADTKRATLKTVQADMTLKSGSWIDAEAPTGVLDARSRQLALSGGVAVYSDSGYEMHTPGAEVDMHSAIITGNRAVAGQGPFGTFRADRFRIDRRARVVQLHGHVRMTIDRRAGRNKK